MIRLLFIIYHLLYWFENEKYMQSGLSECRNPNELLYKVYVANL